MDSSQFLKRHDEKAAGRHLQERFDDQIYGFVAARNLDDEAFVDDPPLAGRGLLERVPQGRAQAGKEQGRQLQACDPARR